MGHPLSPWQCYYWRVLAIIFAKIGRKLHFFCSNHFLILIWVFLLQLPLYHILFGDLKESPSLGESSYLMFSRMAKYSSLAAFYTFSEQQPKAFRTTAKSYRGQNLFASVLKFMYRAVKSTKIFSVPRIFKTKCKLFMCAKGKHKTKRNNSPYWPQNLAEQSSGNNLLNSRILNCVNCINWDFSFWWNRQCQVLTYVLHFIEILTLLPTAF